MPESTSDVKSSEIDRLDPPSEVVSLCSGLKVRVVRLKMRQLFRLLRIVTRGGAQYLPMLREALVGMSEGEDSAEVFGTQFLAVVLMALPEAEDEAVDFISSVVEPVDLAPGSDKRARERNDELRLELSAELYNPEPDDVITILECVVLREKDDLVSLGKRLAAMWTVAAKTEQAGTTEQHSTPSDSTSPLPTLSQGSQDPLTSSPVSTDGLTPRSSTFPSAG